MVVVVFVVLVVVANAGTEIVLVFVVALFVVAVVSLLSFKAVVVSVIV